MKKGWLETYISGIFDRVHGEQYARILYYLIPEYISALIVYSAPIFIDAYFIGLLKSTPSYATLGGINNVLHFMVKIAEALPVATVILVGQFNGRQQYDDVGLVVRDTFWMTLLFGAVIASALLFGAPAILSWYGFNPELIALGTPFLRLRACSVLFMYIYFGLIGFLRGIKNTRTPMAIYIIGTAMFLLTDYLLIFGNAGFPALGLYGSAIASIAQYATMCLLALGYVLFDHQNRKFHIQLFSGIANFTYVKQMVLLSWPVILDKGALSLAYIWLGKMICPLGTCAIASFSVIKDMERFALIPAVACAQVITFLVSNDYGLHKWKDIKTNIKKVIFIGSCMVFSILAFFSFWSRPVIQFFDKQGDFTELAATVFPFLSALVFFDIVQLILSAALRGAGDVRLVMFVRVLVCFGYFVPVSYVLAHMPLASTSLRFIVIYGSFYIGNALMSLVYINRLRSDAWKQHV